MVITLELYKEIRKKRLNGMSQRQIAAALHISRNTVKKYWDGENVPWERKSYSRKASVLTEEVVDFVRKCLDEDTRCKSRKQHHTARRIFERLVAECGFTLSLIHICNPAGLRYRKHSRPLPAAWRQRQLR